MPTCIHGWGSDGIGPGSCPHCAQLGRDNDKAEIERLHGVITDNIRRLRVACGLSPDCTMTTSDIVRDVVRVREAAADMREHQLSAHTPATCASCALRTKGLSEVLGTSADLSHEHSTGEPK
jgi:hypothetical protein